MIHSDNNLRHIEELILASTPCFLISYSNNQE